MSNEQAATQVKPNTPTTNPTSSKVPVFKVLRMNRIAKTDGSILKVNKDGNFTPKDQEELDLLEYFCTTGHLEKQK